MHQLTHKYDFIHITFIVGLMQLKDSFNKAAVPTLWTQHIRFKDL